MTGQIRVIICVRIEDLPVTPIKSQMLECYKCKAKVWVDAKYAGKVLLDRSSRVMCWHCANANLSAAVPVSPIWEEYGED